ncbi:MAG: lipopolysaccharide biosynthesis protein [Candidatus Rokubacteria bacterium]|nr:lipopolysaccharide biosynthesis protein [Candidatus Rokubacteria bacterium]
MNLLTLGRLRNLASPVGWLVTRRGALLEQALRGGVWLFLGDAFTKVAGILKIAVLAHLLAPSDFGVMAIAMAVLKGLEFLTETGFSAALIHSRDDVRAYFDTLWAVQLARALALSIALATAAPLGGWFFAVPEATPVIRAIALVLLLRGLVNPAVVLLRKDLDFQRVVVWRLGGVVVGLAVGISWALVDASAWALVASTVAAQVAETALSYWAVSYRPRLRFEAGRARQLFAYGKWMFWANVLAFIGMYADTMMVGKVLGTGALGFYQMAFELAMLPLTVIGAQVRGVMFPAFSRMTDTAEQRKSFFLILGVLSAIVIPLAAFVTVFADGLVAVVLGSRWLPVGPSLRILVWGAGAATLSALVNSLFQARGRPDLVVKFALVQIGSWAVSSYPLLIAWGIGGMAVAVTASCVLSVLVKLVFVTRLLEARPHAALRAFSVSLAGSLPFVLSAPLARALPPATPWLVPLAAAGLVAYLAILAAALRYHFDLWPGRGGPLGSAA